MKTDRPTETPRGQALLVPDGASCFDEGPYAVRFAANEADLRAAQQLRYEVFNLELGEGLDASSASGLDRDEFDAWSHHLMVIDRATGQLIGTYRLQTEETARQGVGFYCDTEFDLATLPVDIVGSSVELGRACIAKGHRNGTALFALWRGLAAYLKWSHKRWFFGCCSLTSTDPAEGISMWRRLQATGRMHPGIHVEPRPGYACHVDSEDALPPVTMPPLFGTYMRHGGLACGPPALDAAFGTIDFLVLLDVTGMAARLRRLFFGSLGDPFAEFAG